MWYNAQRLNEHSNHNYVRQARKPYERQLVYFTALKVLNSAQQWIEGDLAMPDNGAWIFEQLSQVGLDNLGDTC
jgi:hypothetical protein